MENIVQSMQQSFHYDNIGYGVSSTRIQNWVGEDIEILYMEYAKLETNYSMTKCITIILWGKKIKIGPSFDKNY